MSELVVPSDLEGFPGAPFTDAQVDAAAAAVQTAAGWHIAPQRTDTVSLDVERCESYLRLPTRLLVSVDEIRRTDTDEVLDADGYQVSRLKGQVRRSGCYWPCGYESVEVDMTHGYDSCPADVMAVVARAAVMLRRDPTARTVAIDDFSFTLNSEAVQAALKAELGAIYVLDESLYGVGIA